MKSWAKAFLLVFIVCLVATGIAIRGRACATLWPLLLLGRIGFSNTVFVLIIPAYIVLVYWKKISPALLFFSFALYAVLGFVYIYWFPVPRSVFPAYSFIFKEDGVYNTYNEYYERGYRHGMIDDWQVCGEVLGEVESHAIVNGYSSGAREFVNIFPMLLEPGLNETVQIGRRKSKGNNGHN